LRRRSAATAEEQFVEEYFVEQSVMQIGGRKRHSLECAVRFDVEHGRHILRQGTERCDFGFATRTAGDGRAEMFQRDIVEKVPGYRGWPELRDVIDDASVKK
jgi:hypothetical protein